MLSSRSITPPVRSRAAANNVLLSSHDSRLVCRVMVSKEGHSTDDQGVCLSGVEVIGSRVERKFLIRHSRGSQRQRVVAMACCQVECCARTAGVE